MNLNMNIMLQTWFMKVCANGICNDGEIKRSQNFLDTMFNRLLFLYFFIWPFLLKNVFSDQCFLSFIYDLVPLSHLTYTKMIWCIFYSPLSNNNYQKM